MSLRDMSFSYSGMSDLSLARTAAEGRERGGTRGSLVSNLGYSS